ncbi:MAG: hypothetical protein HQL93_13760 [Magnetococcales bacterium]|nr:hypothetical protein [Magnetococcales bacterium]
MSRILLTLLALLFLIGNVGIMSDAPFIPPSKTYLEEQFSYKLFYYRQHPQVDYLIMGNSRSKPLDPATLAQTLAEKMHQPTPVVHSLSVGGGYFPFYATVMNQLIVDHPPKNLILAISPRDFAYRHRLANSIRNKLYSSSGYTLQQIAYASMFQWLESKSADFLAATMPLLYYRNRGLGLLFPTSVRSWAQPQREAHQTFWQKSVWNTIENLESAEQILPANLESWLQRIRSYPKRIESLIHWSPTPGVETDSMGGILQPPPLSPEEENKRIQSLAEKWEPLRKSVEEERLNPACPQEFPLENQLGKTIQRRFLAAMQEREIGVYFVIVPALRLEGCENSLAINHEWMNQLAMLQAEFSNVRGIIDMNHAFKHAYTDISHYVDAGEHLTFATGRKVTRQLGEAMATMHLEGP